MVLDSDLECRLTGAELSVRVSSQCAPCCSVLLLMLLSFLRVCV